MSKSLVFLWGVDKNREREITEDLVRGSSNLSRFGAGGAAKSAASCSTFWVKSEISSTGKLKWTIIKPCTNKNISQKYFETLICIILLPLSIFNRFFRHHNHRTVWGNINVVKLLWDIFKKIGFVHFKSICTFVVLLNQTELKGTGGEEEQCHQRCTKSTSFDSIKLKNQ